MNLRHWISLAILVASFGLAVSVSAHPPDGVHHAVSVEIEPRQITIRTDLFAGEIAFKDLIAEVDTNADGTITDAELQTWVEAFWRTNIAYQIDTLTDAALSSAMTASFTGPVETLFYVDPLTIITTFDIPADGLPHTLIIKDDYRWTQSDYQMTLLGGDGVEGSLASNTGQVAVINFETDPNATGGNPTELDSSFASGAVKTSFIDRVKYAWLWIVVGAIALAVVGWLILERRKDSHAASTPQKKVKSGSAPIRQKSPNRKK